MTLGDGVPQRVINGNGKHQTSQQTYLGKRIMKEVSNCK